MPDAPQLSLDPRTAVFILLKAREFEAKVEQTDPDEGSNPTDDKAVDILEFQADDAVEQELASAIEALNVDERRDLVALIAVGRGDYSLEEWADARQDAAGVDPDRVADYVLGLPTASTFLEDGLAAFGYAVQDYLGEDYAPRPEIAAER